MKRPRITDIRATTVTVPLEAALRHSRVESVQTAS
jgi:hypothetical protein